MSRPKFAQKTDKNQTEVIEFLRASGVEVLDCSSVGGVPDLLVLYPRNGSRGFAGWLELKVATKGKALFTHKQLEFMALTRWPVRIVNNKEDALIFATTNEGMLSSAEKARLAIFCDGADRKKLFTPGQVQAVLKGGE